MNLESASIEHKVEERSGALSETWDWLKEHHKAEMETGVAIGIGLVVLTEVRSTATIEQLLPEMEGGVGGSIATERLSISSLIDPTLTLPKVDLVTDPSFRVGSGSLVPERFLIEHEGQQIGEATIVTNNREKVRFFNGIDVGAYRGRGYGMATYKAAIEKAVHDGYDFRTHEWSQSESAKRLWERLADKGVARVVKPFVGPDSAGKYSGYYTVDASKFSRDMLCRGE